MAVNYYNMQSSPPTGMQSLIAATTTLGGYGQYDPSGRGLLYEHPSYASQLSHDYSVTSQHDSVDYQRQHSKPGSMPSSGKSNGIAQWLISTFEVAEGLSLPRQTVYEQYEEFCRQTKQDPINAASFGKLIRAIFPNLKTRRLGTRGNSKYHYYGIRVKPQGSGAPAGAAMRSHPDIAPAPAPHPAADAPVGSLYDAGLGGAADMLGFLSTEFPQVDAARVDAPLTVDNAQQFMGVYHAHCQQLLDAVHRLSFGEVEALLEDFWKVYAKDFPDVLASPYMAQLMGDCDAITYETMTSSLIPDALQPLKSQAIKSIRSFAKQLDGWLVTSLSELEAPGLLDIKRKAGKQFSQALRRHTSLNHLAQAARSVLGNSHQLQQMHKDWMRIDFTGIKRQAVAICKCEESTIAQLQGEFESLLRDERPLEAWANWLNTVLDGIIGEGQGEDYAAQVRQFLMRWSFVATLIVRDLTLRSSRSFGSFHLMRLLVDEYLTFAAERKLTRSTPGREAADAAAAAATLAGLPGGLAGVGVASPPRYEEVTDEEEDEDGLDEEDDDIRKRSLGELQEARQFEGIDDVKRQRLSTESM